MRWYLQALRKYATFGGRAGRKEFWAYTLTKLLILAVLWFAHLNALAVLFFVVTFLPTVAVSFRRLHDTSRSGWWWILLINNLPFGQLLLLYFLCQADDPWSNKYGPKPKIENADSQSAPDEREDVPLKAMAQRRELRRKGWDFLMAGAVWVVSIAEDQQRVRFIEPFRLGNQFFNGMEKDPFHVEMR